MLGGGAETGADHGADHYRGFRLAPEHVAEFCRLIKDLVETDAHEVNEHQFGNGPQPAGGGADRRADKGGFAYRRIQEPVAVFGVQPLGDAKNPAPGVVLAVGMKAADNIFPHHNHRLVTGHFLVQCFMDGFLKRYCSGHGVLRLEYSSITDINIGQQISCRWFRGRFGLHN